MEGLNMSDLSGVNAPQSGESNASLMVNAQYIKDFSFESPNVLRLFTEPSNSGPEATLNIGVQVNAIRQDTWEVTLSINAEGKRDDIVAFIIELQYAGVFTITGVPAEHLEAILCIEAPHLLFPFARAIIADVTRDGGIAPFILNPVDFRDLYRRKLMERQAQTMPEPQNIVPN
jgi:preprotein translocase subunit SecB